MNLGTSGWHTKTNGLSTTSATFKKKCRVSDVTPALANIGHLFIFHFKDEVSLQRGNIGHLLSF